MADNKEDILAQFAEFLEFKKQSEQENAAADDEIEIWNADGSGMRGKRSTLVEWLKKNGFSLEPEPEAGDSAANEDKGKGTKTGKQSQSAASTGVARKYFAGQKPAGK